MPRLKPKKVIDLPDELPPIPPTPENVNREKWLTDLALQIEPLFTGLALAPYRVTCGWPSRYAVSPKARRIGECFYPRLTDGTGVHEIFISPCIDDPVDVAGTLTHEMAHVVAGHKASHGPDFVKVARHVGLTKGKPTEASPGELLAVRLRDLVTKLGAYPHKAIVTTRVKVVKSYKEVPMNCPGCGCIIRISVRWIDKAGPPTCSCGQVFVLKSEEG